MQLRLLWADLLDGLKYDCYATFLTGNRLAVNRRNDKKFELQMDRSHCALLICKTAVPQNRSGTAVPLVTSSPCQLAENGRYSSHSKDR